MARNGSAHATLKQGTLGRRSLDEDIAEQLRAAILRGDLAQGERLTELGLADHWQVSQGTIRAALKTLQYEGLVETLPRRGTFVAQITEEDVLEIYTLRDSLEALASRLAAERRDAAGHKALTGILAQMRHAVAAGKRQQMLELDFRFHRTVVDMSGHKRLAEIYGTIEAQTKLFLSMTDQFHHDLDGLLAIHEPLAEAILTGDAERAFALASHHSQKDGTELVAVLFAKDPAP
ncbi:MAG: GntR family transcriptional regulator [Rhodobacteraceae bacterium]|nr:GntR family transcriptional regulator [Paracoccaceae bacterium]